MKVVEKVIPTPGNQYKQSAPFAAKVMENKRLTPEASEDDIRHIVFELTGSGIEYLEGQSIGVITPGEREPGKAHRMRLYSIASAKNGDLDACAIGKKECSTVSLCVKRVIYQDDEGKEQKGVCSNYICDLNVGEEVKLAGPIGRKFFLPKDDTVNLLMVAVGTGIAPFRSFIQYICAERGEWKGKLRLFYGSKTGMESLYMNDENNDIGQYFTEDTFKAFQALSRGEGSEKAYVQDRIIGAKEELWDMVKGGNFCFYLCGLKALESSIQDIFSGWAEEDGLDWSEMVADFKKEGRWNIEVY